MKIQSSMCCCGSGLGSSMLVRMNVEKILKKWGQESALVSHSSVSDATENVADVFVVGSSSYLQITYRLIATALEQELRMLLQNQNISV